jgi:hypothetical protein
MFLIILFISLALNLQPPPIILVVLDCNPRVNENFSTKPHKQPHVVKEMHIFTRSQMTGRGVNHPRLPNGEIKERVQL